MSDTPQRPADPPSQPSSGTSPPPLTVQEWLAAAPKLDPFAIGSSEGAEQPVVPPPSVPPSPAAEPARVAEPAHVSEPQGQPVDVVPIVGMTPITEQERAQVVEDGAEDFVPSDHVESSSAEKSAVEPPAEMQPVEVAPVEPIMPTEVHARDVQPVEVEPVELASANELPASAAQPVMHPAVLPAEPSPRELAEMPPEPLRAVAVPVIAIEPSDPEAVADPTSTEVFVHAHEDVESRGGRIGSAYITKFAGCVGLVACTVGLAILLTACSGFSKPFGVPVLGIGYWVMWVGVGGLVIGILGGLIEHRRMREETHVLGALFSNALAAIGGLLLWLAGAGVDIFAAGTKASGG